MKKEGSEPAEVRPDDEEDLASDNYSRRNAIRTIDHDDREPPVKVETMISHDSPASSSGGDGLPVSESSTTPTVAGLVPKIQHYENDEGVGPRVRAPRSPPHSNQLQSQSLITPDDLPSSPILRRTTHNHRVPYFRYFGPTAIVPGYKQMVVSVRDRRRSTGGSHSGASPLSTPSGIVASSSAADSDIAIEEAPVYDPNSLAPVHPLILQLVTTFFLHVGCNYPFLKQAKFLRLVKEKHVEPILVDAVCAIAARFSDVHALTGGNDKMPRTDRGQAFAQRAKAATVDTFPCPSVGAVQACLLMAYEGFGADQDSALWMYLGLAIRMAVDLGLQKRVGIMYQGEKDPWYTRHRGHVNGNGDAESLEEQKQDGLNPLSPEEQKEVEQERIDTFWSVFVLDRVISSGTGRPVTIRNDDFELPFPEAAIDPATGWPAPFPIFLEIIHLYGGVCDVLNNIRDVKDLTTDKWSRLTSMENELTKEYKNWDCRLQFNVSNFKAYLGMGQGTTFILLHFWFHALFIILHQPTLLTPFGEWRSELQLLSDSRELSMSSAKTICDILAFADLIDPKSFIGNPFTSQPIYIAACAFLMESSANASEGSSREGSPPTGQNNRPKSQIKGLSGNGKQSRHSLLASAANQNYQRCYNSLQQMHAYWGGVKYILTALDQKSKGKWDCETYTSEEYELTKLPQTRATMGSQFARLEGHSSPKMAGPPIAWTLAGTANSPNSNLTLMYQNPGSNVSTPAGGHHSQTMPRQAGTPPGNMVYDPIRQSLPETGTMFPPSFPQPNVSAVRNSPRRSSQHKSSQLSSSIGRGQPPVTYDRIPEEGDDEQIYMPPGYQATSHVPRSSGYESYNNMSSATALADNSNTRPTGHHSVTSTGGGTTHNNSNNSVYYSQGVPFQTASWGPALGNMDGITFDSQDIDMGALGLQQPDLMSNWLEYLPPDVLGIYEEHHTMGQGG